MPWYEEATSCSFSKQWFEFCVSQTSSCKLCPWAASKATVGSSSCGSLDPGCLGTGSFRGTNSTLNTLQLWQMTFPRCYLSFKMDSIAGVLFFQLTQHVLFTAGSRNIYVTFGLTTSNHIPPPSFVLLPCWSWKCNLLLFCLCCSINYWILPCFISSEPGSCCSCSKQVFCTFISFTFNVQIIFSADHKKKKWQGHMGFFGCWIYMTVLIQVVNSNRNILFLKESTAKVLALVPSLGSW